MYEKIIVKTRNKILKHRIQIVGGALILLEIMSTRLANTDCPLLVNGLLFLMSKYFKYNCRNGENKSFYKQPPPTNYKPPQTPVMNIFNMYFVDNLNFYILATTFWAYHMLFSLSIIIVVLT